MASALHLSRFVTHQTLFRPRPLLQNYNCWQVTSFYSRFCSSSSSSSSSDSDSDPPSGSNSSSSNIVSSTSSSSAPKTSEPVVGRRPTPEKRDLLSIPLFTRPHFPKIIAPIIVHDPAACKAFTSLRDTGLRHVGLFLHKQAGLDPMPPSSSTSSESSESTSTTSSTSSDLSFTDANQLHKVGVLAEVIRVAPRQKGVELTFLCHHRVRWTSVLSTDPLLTLSTEPVLEPPVDLSSDHIKAYSLSIIETMKELLRLGSFYKEQLELLLESVDVNNPYHLADLGACLTTADPASLQDVLEEIDISERLRLTLELLKKDLETTRVSRRIHKQIEENVSKSQRKYFLNEQMKQIKKELGLEKDEKETLVTKFQNRLKNKTLNSQIQSTINDEIEKLNSLDPSSSEYNVTRNYLDWLTDIPWGIYNKESLNILKAEQILNEMHYGLNDVKQRILEFIAVNTLRGNIQGKILLLSGPPGVGKTSIGKSIAEALNREFYRFSVGGMGDVAEIKGHRRTYVGAMPGKFVQALKKVKASNPVIMIDEIDKMGRGWTGDPASALLEALDPEQNSGFIDHYMDVPIDLSKVLFLCTANVVDTIPAPLLDRMQSISIAGYILEEKIEIAKRYLVPMAKEDAGLNNKNVKVDIDDSALRVIARDYCREAGVRSLKQQIEKILRKIALKTARKMSDDNPEDSQEKNQDEIEDQDKPQVLVEGKEAENIDKTDADIAQVIEEEKPEQVEEHEIIANERKEEIEEIEIEEILISEDNVEEYLGKKVFSKDRLYEVTPVGIATGLAWTSLGGATLYIECIRVDSNKKQKSLSSTSSDTGSNTSNSSGMLGLKVTGQLGDVMKESSDIALSYAKNYIYSIDGANEFFSTNNSNNAFIHMHVPEGATPKDGPSAGCTMVSALLSLATGKPIRQQIAMTGEVTLTGQVLPVGGIREKAIAAKRSGIKHIILPDGNRKDWDELPDHVAAELTPHFASHYDDVYSICFGEGDLESKDQHDNIQSDTAKLKHVNGDINNGGRIIDQRVNAFQ